MTYNVFGGTLSLTQSINQSPNYGHHTVLIMHGHHAVRMRISIKCCSFNDSGHRVCFLLNAERVKSNCHDLNC